MEIECDILNDLSQEYPCQAETHAIIGCAFAVLNELGHR
jgi:hypothetical protein